MTDIDIIKQIEKEFDIELRLIDEHDYYFDGYIVNSDRKITDLSITECKFFDLNKIVSLIKNLNCLTKLNINSNNIIEISSLKNLSNLKSLYLGHNPIEDISPLLKLKNLTDLDLQGNHQVELNQLKYFKNLKKLFLFDNGINNISPLSSLHNLTELSLSHNQIVDVSPLKELKYLKKLDLINNSIVDVSVLQYLKNLNFLLISRNNIQEISPLKDLITLETLYLGNNKFGDISILKNLTNLNSLNLENTLVKDFSSLANLKNLEDLNLNMNNIRDIHMLKDLIKMCRLQLYDNQISDISPLKNLKQLELLNLCNNNIENLPPWITDFNLRISWDAFIHKGYIILKDNPLKSPPIEIVKQSKEAIKNYFEQLDKQGKDYIYEAKIMIVGEPGAGKTTLMNKLFDRNYPVPNVEQKSTPGIEVRQNCEFDFDNKKAYKAHIWDFGGQQIQYMLHQFFITSDCLYILMADKRKEIANFDYWLNIINLLGKNSPVIVLLNEINIDMVSTPIYDEKKYVDLFPELNTQKLDINLLKINDGRFDFLINTIQEKISQLNLIGKLVPAKWVDIRKDLEEKRKQRHITISEYFEICSNYGIEKEESQLLILNYFHLLGIILHFYDDPNLRNTIFLDPNWTVDAVYSILIDPKIENNNGVFEIDDIDKIWREKGYDFAERGKLLQLMLKDKFDLCYKLSGSENKYIVPLLLPKIKPKYDWENNNNLQFRFQYPFMPKGIVSRLIVRLNEYIEEGKVWNEGAVFHRNGANAQIIERQTVKEGIKIIEIRLAGNPSNRKEFLTLILEEIHKIQKISFPNLPYLEMVPCDCMDCINDSEPEFYDYKVLENLLSENVDKKQCQRKGKMVDIVNLIDAVYKNTKVKKRKKYSEFTNSGANIMKIKEINVFGGQVTFADQIKKVTYEATSFYTEEQFNKLKTAFTKLTEENIKEIKAESETIAQIKTDEEKETLGNKMRSKLISFGVSVAEHMTAIGVVESLKHFYNFL